MTKKTFPTYSAPQPASSSTSTRSPAVYGPGVVDQLRKRFDEAHLMLLGKVVVVGRDKYEPRKLQLQIDPYDADIQQIRKAFEDFPPMPFLPFGNRRYAVESERGQVPFTTPFLKDTVIQIKGPEEWAHIQEGVTLRLDAMLVSYVYENYQGVYFKLLHWEKK